MIQEEMSMEERYCQSCGMPMGETNEYYGTERTARKAATIAAIATTKARLPRIAPWKR